MTKHVPFLPLSNLRLWRQPLITLAWFLLSMVPACLGAHLLVFLYQHRVLSRDNIWLGAGAIMGIMLCVAFYAACKVHRQSKAVREQYFRQTQQP